MRNTVKSNRYRAIWLRFLVSLALLFFAALPPAGAATYLGKAEYLHRGGDPARVIDIVYIPLGYTDSGLYSTFTGFAVPYTSQFMTSYAPFTNYQSFFNIHRLDAYSTVNEEEALRSLAIQNLPDVDLVIFVYLDSTSLINKCGGDSNILACANPGGDAYIHYGTYMDVLVHELGHAIGDLADEYVYTARCPSGVYEGWEPLPINATINTDRSTLKWREWLGIDGVDLFQGALYCSTGVYRPSATCMMGAYDGSSPQPPFDPVCREGLIRQINSRVSPFISQTPSNPVQLNLTPQVMTFSVEVDAALRPQGSAFTYEWYLNNQLISGITTSYTLDLGTLTPGRTHALRVVPIDPDINNYVRIASLGTLQAIETGWFISITATTPTISSFTPNAGGAGAAVAISGTNFTGATAVKFNGVVASFTVVNATQINATVPAGATTGQITVTTPGGTATSSGTFTVLQPPVIISFTPILAAIGSEISINGSNFCFKKCGYYNPANNETQVKLNGAPITPSLVFPGFIQFTLPAGATSGKFTVTTPVGTTTSAGIFSVQGPPGITSFSPTSGRVGATVAMSGSFFCGVPCTVIPTVKLNGVPVTLGTVFAGYMTFTIPAGATTGKFTVTTPVGTTTSVGTFTVTP